MRSKVADRILSRTTPEIKEKVRNMEKSLLENKVINVRLNLSKDGFKWYTDTWDCKESKNVYVLTNEITKHLHKEKLFKINVFHVDAYEIDLNIVTFPHKQGEAMRMLMEKAIDYVNKQKNSIDLLLNVIDQESKLISAVKKILK